MRSAPDIVLHRFNGSEDVVILLLPKWADENVCGWVELRWGDPDQVWKPSYDDDLINRQSIKVLVCEGLFSRDCDTKRTSKCEWNNWERRGSSKTTTTTKWVVVAAEFFEGRIRVWPNTKSNKVGLRRTNKMPLLPSLFETETFLLRCGLMYWFYSGDPSRHHPVMCTYVLLA